jgi:hypothetical protein
MPPHDKGLEDYLRGGNMAAATEGTGASHNWNFPQSSEISCHLVKIDFY